MTDVEMEQLYNTILAGWAAQRQRLTPSDLREMPKLYAAGLMDLDFEVARAAVIRIVHTSTFLPTVAEIRAAAGIVMHGTQVTGAEAWGSVVKAMKEQGSHRTPGVDFWFRDPITERVVKALNWSELCGGDMDKNASDRARFIDAYNEIAQRERTEAAATVGGANRAMLEHRTAPPLRSLPMPAPILSAQERADTLRGVLEEARNLNPHIGPELQALVYAVEPKELDSHPGDDGCCDVHGVMRDEEDICMGCGAPADGPPGHHRSEIQ